MFRVINEFYLQRRAARAVVAALAVPLRYRARGPGPAARRPPPPASGWAATPHPRGPGPRPRLRNSERSADAPHGEPGRCAGLGSGPAAGSQAGGGPRTAGGGTRRRVGSRHGPRAARVSGMRRGFQAGAWAAPAATGTGPDRLLRHVLRRRAAASRPHGPGGCVSCAARSAGAASRIGRIRPEGA